MSIDPRGMTELLEQSQDLHSDGLRSTRAALDEIVELGHERRARGAEIQPDEARRSFLRRTMFAAGALGGGFAATLLGRAMVTVLADSASDIQMLQTSASIENLAIAVYTQAAGLPPDVSGASIPVVKTFVGMTIAQHTEHAQAFNAAVQQLGGKPQTQLDKPVFDGVVTPALGKIKGPADVVGLAITLEDAAAQTYVKFGGAADNANAVKTWASIAPVEAQHVAVLLAVQALVAGGAPQLITLPPDLAKLPAAAGSVGFPNNFYKIDQARPANEGAVAA